MTGLRQRRSLSVSLVLVLAAAGVGTLASLVGVATTASAAAVPPPVNRQATVSRRLAQVPAGRPALSGARGGPAPVTLPTGNGPQQGEADLATHTIYIPNSDDGTVSAIDAATCNGQITRGCTAPSPSVFLGDNIFPLRVVIDPATDTVYTANLGEPTVSVINGATCNAIVTAGCGQHPPQVAAGLEPVDLALDSAAHTLYAANFGDGTVAVINTAHCNALDTSGCGRKPTVIDFGSLQPSGILFDPSDHTVYVANLPVTGTDPSEIDTLSLIDTSTCNGHDTTGCAPVGALTAGIASSTNNVALAIDDTSQTLYVANINGNTVSVVNTSHCRAADVSGCAQPSPQEPAAGGSPAGLVVDPDRGTLYDVSNGNNTVSVVATRTCRAGRTEGCPRTLGTLRAGVNAMTGILDSQTGTLYVANEVDPGSAEVIDADTCNAHIQTGCTRFPPTAPAGSRPLGIAVIAAAHTAYVTNPPGNTVSVIDTAKCTATSPMCPTTPPTISVPGGPSAVAVDPTTDTIYVASNASGPGANTVSVINGATCNAAVLSGCGQRPPTITVGRDPEAIALDPATHTAYVANQSDNTLSVIDTSTCDGEIRSGCTQTPTTVTTGPGPGGLFIDHSAHTLYVANQGDDTLSLLDTWTCDADHRSGCTSTLPTAAAGPSPQQMTLDVATFTLYVTDALDRQVAMVDTQTCNTSDTAGCQHTPKMIPVGNHPQALTLDATHHRLYVGNLYDNSVSLINTNNCNQQRQHDCSVQPPSITVGNGPEGLALDPSSNTLYVTDGLEAGLDDNVSLLRR